MTILDVQAVSPDSGYRAVWKDENGRLKIAFFGLAPLNGSGRIVAITVESRGGGKTPTPRLSGQANAGLIPVTIVNPPGHVLAPRARKRGPLAGRK